MLLSPNERNPPLPPEDVLENESGADTGALANLLGAADEDAEALDLADEKLAVD